MKALISYFLLAIFLLFASVSNPAYAAPCDEGRIKKTVIESCFSLIDATERKLCNRERDLRMVRRAINTLAIAPDDDSTFGGASDCAATAEADCNGVLEDVDSLSYEDGICIWVCKAFAAPSNGNN